MSSSALLRLEALRKCNTDPNWVNADLYRLLYKTDLYVVAYEKIKSAPGNMTPGTDGVTLDGFSMGVIDPQAAEARQAAPLRTRTHSAVQLERQRGEGTERLLQSQLRLDPEPDGIPDGEGAS